MPLRATLALPLFLIPGFGKLENYPRLHTPELDELARWAHVSTPKDAVFVFPEAGKGLEPGIFRAKALRAVYVDWKGGSQMNVLKGLGEEWWRRWQAAMAGSLATAHGLASRETYPTGISQCAGSAAQRKPKSPSR